MSAKPAIAFIGTGVMGRSMAGHLLAAGHELHVFNRTRAKAQPLLDSGALWHDSPGAAAAAAGVVVTMLGFPHDVEETYLGAGGVVERAGRGSLLIDMTTSSPLLARKISAAAEARGLEALDAPVSGGDVGAREARLVIMVGGKAAAYERALPILSLMGKNLALQGPAGAGQHCKMANQIACAVGMVAWCEALAYAKRAGLDPLRVHGSISGGAAGSWAMTHLGPRALAGDFAPGFYVKHIRKDIGIAIASAEELGLELPGLECARKLYDRVASKGWEEFGTQILYRLYASL
ncbi:MAG: NAD(P)-dependent oxidoreductase [Opitutaceae bacterium]|jgi:3-hydroxyisobutyrate dehydrogenase